MEKEIARSVIQFTADKEAYELILEYVNSRIEYHKNALANALTLDDVRKSQGAIRELSRMVTLRDEAISILNQ